MTRILTLPVLSALAIVLVAADRPPSKPGPAPTRTGHALQTAPTTKTGRKSILGKVTSASLPREPAVVTGPRARVHHHERRRRSAAVSRIAAANRAATLEPVPHGFVNAVQVYPFADGALYQAYTAPERVTDIALQPGEALGAVASGDTVRWVIGDTTSGSGAEKRTHVLVKPFTTGLSTNLVITTDRRVYHVALVSTAGAAMAALSWEYPQDTLIALKKEAVVSQGTAPVATGLEVAQLHFDYAVSGDRPAWRPLRAFDNGRQTFIEFPTSLAVGEAPPLFLVDAHGDAQLVNYRVSGHFYVVDRLFDVAELRLGTKHQDVVRIARSSDGAASHLRARNGS